MASTRFFIWIRMSQECPSDRDVREARLPLEGAGFLRSKKTEGVPKDYLQTNGKTPSVTARKAAVVAGDPHGVRELYVDDCSI